MMEVDSDNWRERNSLRLLCDDIRRSLHEVAAFEENQEGAKQAGEDGSRVVTRLYFLCGSARYKENQNCWILRSTRDSSSKKPRSSVSRKKHGYGSVLVGTSKENTDEQLEPYHNASIARVQLRGSRGEKVQTPAPVRLIQRIFRITELRWAFEYLESSIPAASDPEGKHPVAEFKKETIDLEPMYSYLLENCSRYFGVHGRKQVTQDAIAFCSTVTSDDNMWTTTVYDSNGTQTSSKRNSRVPRILRSLLESCLEEDNPEGSMNIPPSRHPDDCLLDNARMTRCANSRNRGVSTKPRGHKGVMESIIEEAPSLIRRSERQNILPPNDGFPSANLSEGEYKEVDSNENELKPYARAPRRCMRCVEFDGGSAHDCRGRGGVRHCEHFTANGVSIKANPKSISSMQAPKNDTFKAAWTSAEKLGYTTAPCRSSETHSKYSDNVNWMKLSHVGHISDYHGMQRRYESFFPLTLKTSANEMINDIGRTLQEHHFDEMIESDEEVMEENNAYKRVLSSYAPKARKERSSKRRRHAEAGTSGHQWFDNNLPVIFLGDEGIGREFKADIHCSGNPNGRRAEDTVLGPTALLHTFREVDSNPSFFRNGEVNLKETGRPSRRREIATQRKASLSMLYHLKQSLKFIAAYNFDGDDSSNEDAKESFGSYRPSVKHEPHKLREPRKAHKLHASEEEGRLLLGLGEIDEKSTHNAVVHYSASLSLDQLIHECKHQYSKRQESIVLAKISRKPSIQSMREFLNSVDEYQAETPCDDDLAEQRTYQRAVRSYGGKADQERIEKLKHEDERAQGLMHRSRARKPSRADLEVEALETRALLFMTMRTTAKESCPFGSSCAVCSPHKKTLPRRKASMDVTILHPTLRRIDDEVLYRCDEFPLEKEDIRRNRSRDKAAKLHIENERLGHLHRRLDFVELYNSGWITSSSRRIK